jgi:hypothetical protein
LEAKRPDQAWKQLQDAWAVDRDNQQLTALRAKFLARLTLPGCP